MSAKVAPDRMKSLLEGWTGTTRVWQPGSERDNAYSSKSVTGELLRVEEWTTEHGPARVAVILDDLDGKETAIFTTAVALARQWEEQQPGEGDRIGVAYGGQDEGQNGRVYNRFKLMVERTGYKRKSCELEPGDMANLFADQ